MTYSLQPVTHLLVIKVLECGCGGCDEGRLCWKSSRGPVEAVCSSEFELSMVSDRGRVIAGGGVDITDPMLRHKEATHPDTRPDKPPFRKTT